MKASFFQRSAYSAPHGIRSDWPVSPALYEAEYGRQSLQHALEQCAFADHLGFDWVSFSEHHYMTTVAPNPALATASVASRVRNAKIAMIGHNLTLNNPIRVAKDLAVLDTLSASRLVVGFLRGTPTEFQTYTVNLRRAVSWRWTVWNSFSGPGLSQCLSWLGGTPLSIPHSGGLAAPGATAISALLCTGKQQGHGSVCRTSSLGHRHGVPTASSPYLRPLPITASAAPRPAGSPPQTVSSTAERLALPMARRKRCSRRCATFSNNAKPSS